MRQLSEQVITDRSVCGVVWCGVVSVYVLCLPPPHYSKFASLVCLVFAAYHSYDLLILKLVQNICDICVQTKFCLQ